jgi:tetratricopeptide (TPR) repeat protein
MLCNLSGQRYPMLAWLKPLQHHLDTADFDEALAYVDLHSLDSNLHRLPLDNEETLRACSLIAEIRDYAGQYAEAKDAIQQVGSRSFSYLKEFLKESSGAYFANNYLKEQCWASLHWGMYHYRLQNYEYALEVFTHSERALRKVHKQLPCPGSLARALYCLGLVAREEHRYNEARTYFSSSVEMAGLQLRTLPPENPRRKAVLYNIGKCLGLGMAYVAFAQSAHSEANTHIVAARLLLEGRNVKFIHAYVDFLHAATQLSAHGDSIEEVSQAIEQVKVAYQKLGGDQAILQSSTGGTRSGHTVYALRAANELASAYLRRLRLRKRQAELSGTQADFEQAISYLNLVRSCETTRTLEKRTYCNAWILESRAYRENSYGEEPSAETRAAIETAVEQAASVGSGLDFSRIDSHIAAGEAHYFLKNFKQSIEAFNAARAERRAATNPKIIAVCELHLARCYLAAGESGKALNCFASWETAGCYGLENSFIRELSAEVRLRLEKACEPFRVDPEDDLNATLQVRRFHYWLAKSALVQCNDDRKAAAKKLGKSQRTLKDWEKPINSKR